MTFNKGKFYNGNNEVVALEFGNEQQIAILNRIEALKEGIVHSAYSRFVCPCGAQYYRPFDEGHTFECDACGFKYQFFVYDANVPCIKLLGLAVSKTETK